MKRIYDHPAVQDTRYIRWEPFPEDLLPLLTGKGFEGCIAMQAEESEKETDMLISLSKMRPFIKGVIGWVDLQAQDVMDRLDWYRSFPILKGFRHPLQHEAKRNLMNQPAFVKGIAALGRYGFTYDILIYPDQLKFVKRLAALFPDQYFALDLLAPSGGAFDIGRWREDLWTLAKQEHVYCKISGMIPKLSKSQAGRENFLLYLQEMVAAFGMDRVMYGWEWPLRYGAEAYTAGTRIIQEYFSMFSKEEQELFYVWNAVNFYNL